MSPNIINTVLISLKKLTKIISTLQIVEDVFDSDEAAFKAEAETAFDEPEKSPMMFQIMKNVSC